MIPTYILTGETFDLKDRGIVHMARTACVCNTNDLSELIGQELEVMGKKKKIIGIERFAIHDQSHKLIGILVSHG